MSKIFLFLIAALALFANELKLTHTVPLSASALDLSLSSNKLYLALANGDICVLDKQKAKKLYSLPKILTPYKELINQRAATLDVLNDKIAVGAQDGNLYISDNNSLQKTKFSTTSLIRKVAFITPDKVLLCLINGQVVLFDIKTQTVIFATQVSSSSLSDMALSSDKQVAAIVGEAGFVFMLDTKNGTIKATYKNVNLDNIYKVSYENGMILTAGQDRKATLLKDNGQIITRFDGDFLIYAASLNPNASRAAIAFNEQSDIVIYNTLTKAKVAVGSKHSATLNKILFLSQNSFASAADENKILIWEIKD